MVPLHVLGWEQGLTWGVGRGFSGPYYTPGGSGGVLLFTFARP